MHEQDGDTEPSHHARRPMNAFLIFCKRHRSVVRDKYPNLENRSITKILGEWWANLENEEKACYTGLAKQYKDAFFNANPDFKWYKLPAPPLRTLSSRPRDPNDKRTDTHDQKDVEFEEKTNNNSTEIDFNKPNESIHEKSPKPYSLSFITPGKLADEAQMGGLSSLLETNIGNQTENPYYSPFKYSTISSSNEIKIFTDDNKPKTLTNNDNIRDLQNELSETTKIFEDGFDENHAVYSNDQLTNQDVIDQIVDKRLIKDDYILQGNLSDEEKNSKFGRSCKGKRYQQFMAVGGLILNKRQRRDYNDRTQDDYNASCSWEMNNSREEDYNISDEIKENDGHPHNDTSTENHSKAEDCESEMLEHDHNALRTYKADDFDLDAKIKALPSLSLEKFQQKKRENKRKKKTISLKPKHSNSSSQIVNSVHMTIPEKKRELVENWRETVIGSQKRKPRKISITRLEINSMVSAVDKIDQHKISPEIKFATEAPNTMMQSMEICREPCHRYNDLLALATLAEVAANTSKIEEASLLLSMTAKSSDNNASMVLNTN